MKILQIPQAYQNQNAHWNGYHQPNHHHHQNNPYIQQGPPAQAYQAAFAAAVPISNGHIHHPHIASPHAFNIPPPAAPAYAYPPTVMPVTN